MLLNVLVWVFVDDVGCRWVDKAEELILLLLLLISDLLEVCWVQGLIETGSLKLPGLLEP
jgi:hypothetical protein